MSVIERTIQVGFQLRVHFTQGVFDAANPLLKDVLVNQRPGQIRKALVILDESLAAAQLTLTQAIENYFAAFPESIKLVCAPMTIEGGERAKNSYFHVSE